MKRVLMIAYHFPPVGVSSGVHRTLAFAWNLPRYQWQPEILTVPPGAYEQIHRERLADVPASLPVSRAFALDTARHLSLGGRYPRLLALPDRWVSWWPAGVLLGLRLIRRQRPAVLWSTYPIATAHLIALTLHRLTGIPWVADFRDSMVDAGYPVPGLQRRVFQRVERWSVNACQRAVFTTPGTQTLYRERYSQLPDSRWAVIPNGYDEIAFHRAERLPASPSPKGVITLVHSGLLHPSERDPIAFFTALTKLRERGELNSGRVRIVLRSSRYDDYYRTLLEKFRLQDMVHLAPGLPYHQALREMLDADGLLLFQAANCNHQIPAKLYEYLRAGRPIFALTDPAGDTARLLESWPRAILAPLDDPLSIVEQLKRFMSLLCAPGTGVTAIKGVEDFSRQAQTADLAELLDTVAVLGIDCSKL